MKEFYKDFSSKLDDYENISPYSILDGKWGGFGPTSWFTGIDKENPKNVFEVATKCNKSETIIESWYFKVFDVKIDKWRPLTKEESNKYKIPNRKFVKADFSKISVSMPKFKKSFPDIDLRSIMMVQPMCE